MAYRRAATARKARAIAGAIKGPHNRTARSIGRDRSRAAWETVTRRGLRRNRSVEHIRRSIEYIGKKWTAESYDVEIVVPKGTGRINSVANIKMLTGI